MAETPRKGILALLLEILEVTGENLSVYFFLSPSTSLLFAKSGNGERGGFIIYSFFFNIPSSLNSPRQF